MGDLVEFTRGTNGSTGPRTAAGKRRSSANARKHGLYAQSVVVRGVEDEREFEALLRDVLAFHDVADPIVEIAAERFVAAAWRLRRVRRLEAEKLSEKAARYSNEREKLDALRQRLGRVLEWCEAATVADREAFASATVVASIMHAVRFVIAEAGKQEAGNEAFSTKRVERIIARGKRVRIETLMDALDEAIGLSSIKFRGLKPDTIVGDGYELLRLLETCMTSEAKALRKEIEDAERDLLRALTTSLELNWDDARSLSDAERRLDSQFSRAMRDFHEARRVAIESERPAKPSTANAR